MRITGRTNRGNGRSESSSHTEGRRLLRGSIISLKSTQNAKDFHEASRYLDDRTNSLAIGDIIDSAKVPMLQQPDSDEFFDSWINRNSVDALNSSVIYKSLSEYDPNCSEIYKRNMTGLRKKPRKKLSGLVEELRRGEENKKKLVEALELWEKARKIGSVGSLTIYFAAGVIFDEIEMHEKAIECFKRSARIIPAEIIVDTYMLPDDAVHKRKVERYSRKPLQEYLEQRALRREKLIFDETERQRLCAIVAYAQLIRLYLIVQRYPESQTALAAAFSLSNQAREHSELLKYAHDIFKSTWDHSNREVSRSYKIVNGSSGSIAESHLQILHELLEENSRDIDILTWLGHRYTEKCEFEVARDYYKRARDLKINKADLLNYSRRGQSENSWSSRVMNSSRSKKLSLPSISNEANEFTSKVTIEKVNTHAGYSIGLEADSKVSETRADFTRFNKCREGSETVIYAPPEAGWVPGVDLAVYNFYRSKQFSRESAQFKSLEHDSKHLYPDSNPNLYIRNDDYVIHSTFGTSRTNDKQSTPTMNG